MEGIRITVASLIASSLLLGQDATWMKLGHIGRGNTYFVVLRDGTCLQGKIQSRTPDSLTIAVPNPNAKPNPNIVASPRLVTVARSDAREVKDGYREFDILHSGRSSWRDVRAIPADRPSREYLSGSS
jgi:hypothetical protein